LHGLTIASELELPQLRAGREGAPDAVIEFGPVEPLPPDAASQFRNWTARPQEMVITALGSARFRVTGGSRITIDALPEATQADLVSFALGSAMSALLQQRELLPLHASSVVTDAGALLVTGRSGAGKSTLVAELVGMGLPILADDVTALDFRSTDRVLARPGLPALRLWSDALIRLGKQEEAQQQVREDVEKFYLPVTTSSDSAHPVCAIVRLTSKGGGELDLRELDANDRLIWLNHHVHRKHFLPGMGLQKFAFDATIRLANEVPILEITRPDRGVAPEEIARTVLKWLADQPGPAKARVKASQ
jgi:hypothetical protein